MVVVDDHRTFTDLLRLALAEVEDLECVGAAHDGAEAMRLVAAERPDVVVMDVELRHEDGIALTARLLAAHPDLRVIVLTAHGEDLQVARRAAAAGASALLPKDGSLPELLHHLRTARSGGMVVHPHLLQALITPRTPVEASPFARLTGREEHVLHLLSQGHDVRRIAGELHLSVHTCRGYVKSLLAKLGAHSQLEAVAIARTHGLLGDPGPH